MLPHSILARASCHGRTPYGSTGLERNRTSLSCNPNTHALASGLSNHGASSKRSSCTPAFHAYATSCRPPSACAPCPVVCACTLAVLSHTTAPCLRVTRASFGFGIDRDAACAMAPGAYESAYQDAVRLLAATCIHSTASRDCTEAALVLTHPPTGRHSSHSPLCIFTDTARLIQQTHPCLAVIPLTTWPHPCLASCPSPASATALRAATTCYSPHATASQAANQRATQQQSM